MTTILWRSSGRYLQRHPWLIGLSILGVALGVAVVVSIDLANTSARQGFALSTEAVTGKATHTVVGTGMGIPDQVYHTLRVEQGLRESAPVVEGYARTPLEKGRTFSVLGIDPLAEAPFRAYTGGVGSGLDLGRFMTESGTALLSETTADAFGLVLGDTIPIIINGVEKGLVLVGVMWPEDEHSARAMADLIIVDISTAQEVFDMPGQLSRIDLLKPGGVEEDAWMAPIEGALPEGVGLVRSSARTETVDQMTRAFNLNLTALSLLALVVGMFLIYNTMTFSVVQRRDGIGRLRALGVTRREVFQLILAEALFIGVVGTGVGLLLGIVLGQGLTRLITRTINDLYFVLQVRDLHLAPLTLFKGVVLGLGATLLAAFFPAREATKAAVGTVMRRSLEESRIQRLLPKLTLGGVLLGILAVALLQLPSRSIVVSYGALLGVLLAFALVTPGAIVLLAHLIRPGMGRLFGVLGRMAARGVVTTLSRTAIAVAALMIAIAATMGVGVMVDSFRATVQVWLGYSLQADVYIQPPHLVFRKADASLMPSVLDIISQTDGVAGVYRVQSTQVDTDVGRVDLIAFDQSPQTPKTFQFKEGDPDAIWSAFEVEDMVVVSEPFSYRFDISVGDTLQLQTDQGGKTFTVRGVFYDYGSDLGMVMMGRSTFQKYYEDQRVAGLALYAMPGQEVEALVRRIQERVVDEQEVIVRSNKALREASLDIFDRTFTVTVVLRLLAILVAFVGVLSALMALQLERARELAILRANGLTPRQVWQYVTLQTGLMGFFSGLLSIPLGLTLAYVLIFVINKRSFGWTLQMEISHEILGQALLVALLASILAGIYPSWKMAKTNPAMALRDE